MNRQPDPSAAQTSTESAELPRPSRSAAEIQWLLLAVVALYLVTAGGRLDDQRLVAWSVAGYAGFVLLLRGLARRHADVGLKLYAQVWAMLAVITTLCLESGGQDSVLRGLYLLPVAAGAAQLDRRANAAHLLLIGACYLLLGARSGAELMSIAWGSRLLVELAPLALVGLMLGRLAADLRLAGLRIHTLSEIDELTGLWNMRAFNRMHRREHDQAQRHGRPYCLMMLDMDNLKLINDTHGHEAGNKAIKAVARALARITRVTDAVARFGGDEFVVLLHEADRHMASDVAGRIQKTLAATQIELDGRRITASASIGYACFPADGGEPTELLGAADRRMYEQKRRNAAGPGRPPDARPRL